MCCSCAARVSLRGWGDQGDDEVNDGDGGLEGFLILGLTLIPTMKRLRTSVLRRPACGIYLRLGAHPTPSPLKDQPISNFDQCPPNPTLPQMTVMLHAVVTPSPLKDQPISKFDQCTPNPTPLQMTVLPHAVATQSPLKDQPTSLSYQCSLNPSPL